MFPIGLSTIDKEINEALFLEYKKAGLTHVELSLKIPCDVDFKKYLNLSKKYDITINSYHLPYEFTDISHKDAFDRTLKIFSKDILKASDIGVKKIIVHPSGEIPDLNDKQDRLKRAKEGLYALAEIANKNDANICVENLPRTCLGKNSDEMKDLLSVHKNLKVCFDTNHLLTEDPVSFITNLGEKIITTHVSDYDFVNERHWLPGEGKLEFFKIIKALKDVNYKGAWIYEVPPTNTRTIIRERAISPADFALNAKELFLGKKPTIFSKPKPNLGM